MREKQMLILIAINVVINIILNPFKTFSLNIQTYKILNVVKNDFSVEKKIPKKKKIIIIINELNH
jgi:hypothetical protein